MYLTLKKLEAVFKIEMKFKNIYQVLQFDNGDNVTMFHNGQSLRLISMLRKECL